MLNYERETININRTKIYKDIWLSLKRLAPAFDMDREQLINMVLETFVKTYVIKPERKQHE